MNELILFLSLLFEFSLILLSYKFFGKSGLYVMTVICAILANIEVVMLIKAFGIEQTLGNTLFAASFLITDILSENEGKKAADKAVHLGIFATVVFLIISSSWLFFTPAEADTAYGAFKTIFSQTPRVMLASLLVYAVSQKLDVWLYHAWWNFTTNKCGDKKRFAWVRNNGSTLISQFINTCLFNFGAFLGTYEFKTVLSITLSSYIIFAVAALLDTPFLYLSRRIKK